MPNREEMSTARRLHDPATADADLDFGLQPYRLGNRSENELRFNTSDAIQVSELFSSYEEEFFQSLQQAHRGLDSIELAPNSQLEGAVVEALQQAETCILHMELDLQTIPHSDMYLNLIRKYRMDLQEAHQRMQDVIEEVKHGAAHNSKNTVGDYYAATSNRSTAASSASSRSGGRATAEGKKGNLMRKATHTLQQSTRELDESRKIAAETEEVGLSVLGQLSIQRDTIRSARQKGEDVLNDMLTSRRSLRQIRRRLAESRITVMIVALLLVFSFVYLRYYASHQEAPLAMAVVGQDGAVLEPLDAVQIGPQRSPQEAFHKNGGDRHGGAPLRRLAS